MKAIEFTTPEAQQLYTAYFLRVKRTISPLNKADQEELLMEINSHIYEGLQGNPTSNELEKITQIIEQLGAPEEVLKPLVAEKKLEQATRTFNPLDVVKALILNLSNGISYIIFALLYLALFGFIFLIGAKLLHPKSVGLFFKNGRFHLLGTRNPDSLQKLGLTEVLGHWFIPTMLCSSVVLYFFITLLLRLKKKVIN